MTGVATGVARLRDRRREVVVVGVGLVLGAAAFLLHAGSFVGHNGDHIYYTSMALQFAGVPYDHALQTTTHYFTDYPRPWGVLDQGYQQPWLAPLMYPRNMLPVLATPFVKAYGVSGIWVPGIACGVASLLGLVGLAWRRVSPVAAAAVPILVLGSTIAPEYVFGIFSESPLILLVTAMVAVLPLGRSRGWRHAALAAALVPLMMLCRQVPVLPLGMVLGGWVWASVRARSPRNAWLPIVATVTPVALVADVVQARWAPFDPLQVLRTFTGGQHLGELVRLATPLFLRATRADLGYAARHDLVLVATFALALLGLVSVIKHPLAGVFAGALGSGLLSEFLSPSAVRFRYESPALPVLVLLAAVGVARLAALVARREWTLPALAGGPPSPDSARTAGRRRPVSAGWAGAAGAWVVALVALAVVVHLHRPASLAGAPQVQVSQASYGPKWPFSVPAGTVICAGSDYEIWFRTPDGTRYALSGTAMSHSLLTPRAESLRAGTTTNVWYGVLPIINQGMKLCGRGYAGVR